MAEIVQTTHSNVFILLSYYVLIQISPEFDSKGLIDNNSESTRIMRKMLPNNTII